ncbi:uncharacterized protein LOC120346238 [Styela clava]
MWLNDTKLKIIERGTAKRRCGSPRHFPRKVHISEEKVAEELGNLCIGIDSTGPSTSTRIPDFMYGKPGTNQLFKDIEEGLEIDSDVNDEKGTIQIAPELAAELKKLNRKILTVGSYWQSARLPKPCQELVLWKPPSGAVADILNAMKETEETQNTSSKIGSNSTDEIKYMATDDQNCANRADEDFNNTPSLLSHHSFFTPQTNKQENEYHPTERADFVMDYMEL